MAGSRIHFEQVPVEMVKKIAKLDPPDADEIGIEEEGQAKRVVSGKELSPTSIPSFNIFRMDNDDSPLWIEAAPTLEEAERRVKELATSAHTRYLVFDQKTGDKRIIDTTHQRHRP